jgi:tetratricopeptide (TPR) repeat protein
MGRYLLQSLYNATRHTLGVLAVVAASRVAAAQPAPTPEEVQQAQVRWNEGKAYFDAGNFEAARVAFKQAYTVFPHATFLQNLGEAELRSGRNVEAARHFTAFLRASSSSSPAQRELAKKSLARASERLGSIVVSTNIDDAEIRVDDELVGRSPLGNYPWYVDAGRHVVTARKDGYLDGVERIDVTAGPPRAVLVRVQRVVSGTSEIPQEAKPAPAVVAATTPAAAEGNSATQAPPPASESQHSGIPARTVVLLSGAALTIGSAAVGTVYAFRANAAATRIDNHVEQMMQLDKRKPPEPASYCKLDDADPALCAAYQDDNAKLHADQRVRDIAFVSAGVFGVATLATALLWRTRPATVSIAPVLNLGAPGAVLSGQF